MAEACRNGNGKNGSRLKPKRSGRSRMGADTDRQLILGLNNRDPEALESLMRRHHARLFQHVEGICRNTADTEEVLQDTYVTTWAKIGDFRGRASLFTWMYRIAANTALMKRRKEERERRSTVPLEEPAQLSGQAVVPRPWLRRPECPEQSLLTEELRRTVRKASGQLGEIYRDVFELRDLHGYTIKETCDSLGLTESAAKSRLRRSRICMQKHLKAYLGQR